MRAAYVETAASWSMIRSTCPRARARSAKQAFGSGAPARMANGANLAVGAEDAASNWVGKIDDLRIYGRVLTQAEVQAIYSGG